MFTGIVQAVGTIMERTLLDEAAEFTVRAPAFAVDLDDGDSVAVNGVCHTVTASTADTFQFLSGLTTLQRTTFAELEPGRSVNLELPLRVGDTLGGHMVQGHVDSTGEVTGLERHGETVLLRVTLPDDVAAVTVERGSLAVDGVSLTVSRLEDEVAEIALIPYTWTHTSFEYLEVGDRVNLEADLIGKYVERLIGPYASRGASGSAGNPAD
jgi:riboflavin synthase